MKDSSRSFKIPFFVISVSCASFAFAGIAKSATISGGSFSNPLQTAEINQTANLFKFNQALGTLTSATLSFTGRLNQTFTGRNQSTNSQTAIITISTALNLNIPGLTLSNPNNGIPAITFSQSTGIQLYAPGQTKNFGPFTPTNVVNYVFPPNSSLAFFTGIGEPFSVNCTTLSTTTILGAGGNVRSNQNTQAACGASLEYTYTPAIIPPTNVPEPSTMLAILTVAGARAFARRQR
jgi:hypothetical protein